LPISVDQDQRESVRIYVIIGYHLLAFITVMYDAVYQIDALFWF